MNEQILRINDLAVHFYMDKRIVPAVDGVSFSVSRGETLGLVGESGCGKSVTALSIMRLLPSPPARIVRGEIWFKGENLLDKTNEEMRKIRGNDISMIFQEPMTSLNPVFTVGCQISEVIMQHQNVSKKEALERAIEMLRMVKIPLPEKRIKQYPHQLSGGMRQRVMIAMALACNPELLIADEPTTALDVTIEAQILELINELKERFGSSVIMITHDLGVVAEIADKVAVMYSGRILEQADVHSIFNNPKHPYTQGLLETIPDIDLPRGQRLKEIKGVVPLPDEIKVGCRFKSRCEYVRAECMVDEPPLMQVGSSLVRCWNYA
ncbi:peptide/nickel transport system ATP-binding protein/oligopeptide transport system ATP-binding protein [Caldicoprobacter faecalis]|uniref:Peptide/nickel transport system ATP-binding protein/oligopeptide transport system ATP-binding protein n=1 Tax=Caldicoprobacter faecalis TaxID=937334 RepID=A0A1I5UUJ8_9FIRM|nr:peptide/nickel transport system ATP-binding protein/oligopeptide transport system ATP-binding protein [Caldicoprobacter faecalis]